MNDDQRYAYLESLYSAIQQAGNNKQIGGYTFCMEPGGSFHLYKDDADKWINCSPGWEYVERFATAPTNGNIEIEFTVETNSYDGYQISEPVLVDFVITYNNLELDTQNYFKALEVFVNEQE